MLYTVIHIPFELFNFKNCYLRRKEKDFLVDSFYAKTVMFDGCKERRLTL